MGFFKNAFKHPGWYAAGVVPGLLMNNLGQPEKGIPAGPVARDPLTAKDVVLQNPLKTPLRGIQTNANKSLESALGSATEQMNTNATAAGRIRGDYAGQELARANDIATQNVNNSIYGVLGDTSLKYKQNDLGYGDNLALAQRIGALNKPSTLQEILAGINGGANAAGSAAALYSALNSKKAPKVDNRVYSMNLPSNDAGSYYNSDLG